MACRGRVGYWSSRWGKIKTIYDENGRATETQIFNAAGHKLTQFVCTYDADGWVLEQKKLAEDPAQLFIDRMSDNQKTRLPSEQIPQIKQAINAKLGELNARCGGGQSFSGVSYTYDTQGRAVSICQGGSTILLSSNDQGDQTDWRQFRDGVSRFWAHYVYNDWTQQSGNYPDNSGEPGPVINRKLTYY